MKLYDVDGDYGRTPKIVEAEIVCWTLRPTTNQRVAR